jgi:membrane protein DedA with SNARE-associated domain
LLLLAGVLVASGAFPLWVILLAAYAAMAFGMFAGFGWARAAGQVGLQSLAEKVKAQEMYERAQARLRSSSPWEIGLARMVPGLRPYATLVSGAAEVDPVVFAVGALPALLVWEVALVVAGILVGLPVAELLNRFEKAALRGAALLALVLVTWLATRHVHPDESGGITRLGLRLRAVLAVLADAAIVGAGVTGLGAIIGLVIHLHVSVWTGLAVAAVLLVLLLLLGRRVTTPGEALFDTHYWHQRPHPDPSRSFREGSG